MSASPASPRASDHRTRPGATFVPETTKRALNLPGRVTAWERHPKTYRRLAALLLTAIFAFSVAPVFNNLVGDHNKDYNLWYWSGRTYLEGTSLYPTDNRPFPFMYPPAAAVLLALASVCGERPFLAVLLVTNAVAWTGAIFLSVKLATGAALRQRPLLYLVPSVWALPFISDMFLLGQPNLLLLFLILGSFGALRARRDGLAGALIALAAGIKAFPILAVGYLVYRRRWKALAATGIALVGFVWGAPACFRGPAEAWSDLRIWTNGMVLKYDEEGIAQRPERCYSFKNQSLVAVANRLLRDVPADGEAKDGWHVNLVRLDFRTVNALILAAAVVLGIGYMVVMRWREPADHRAASAETAMLALLILIFSPFAFNYFYVWLLYPLTVVLARFLESAEGTPQRRVLGGGLLASAVVFGMLAVTRRGAQAYGNLLAVNLILLGLLAWSIAQERRVGPRTSATTPVPQPV